MRKETISLIVGIFIGIIFGVLTTGIAMSVAGGNLILKEIKSPYDLDKTVSIISQRLNESEGWHVVAIYDEQKEILENGGEDIGKMKIIKYCNGKYAGMMLKADDRKKIGAMLPKTFAVYEKSDGQVYVSTSNGEIIAHLFGGEAGKIIEKVSYEVEDIMRFMNFKFSII